jgi:CubicO group peptidase (beta-lactamase class C family)
LLGFQPDLLDQPLLPHLPVKIDNSFLELVKLKYLATHTAGFPDSLSGLNGSGAVYLFGNASQPPELPPANSAIYEFWSNWYPTDPINKYCKKCSDLFPKDG